MSSAVSDGRSRRSPSSRLAFSFVRDLLLRAKHLFAAATTLSAARRDPADIPFARVIDGRRVAAGGLAADDLASCVVERRRAAAVGRGAADALAGLASSDGAACHRGV